MACRTSPARRLLRLLAVASGLAAGAQAQAAGWVPGQVNATMCFWEQLRASVVRDTLYLDGGNLWWIPGMNDSSYGPVTNDENPLGIVYTLNFSVPFDTSDNITADMGLLYKASAGTNANNIAPNYYDGAMLANDDEWFLYGGLLRNTVAFSMPDADASLCYQADQYGVDKPSFRPGFLNVDLPSPMTRYIAYGGAANAPSENKAWYFGGLRSPSWGPIYTISGNDSLTAVNASNTLITLNMATQQEETWTNKTLTTGVLARANPELVWVPVGSEGVLVAIGGVTYPEFVSVDATSENAAASKAQSPAFMTTLDVYDVANKTWYKQPTTGGSALGQRTRGCAVLATAADASSFNIYWYGGFDGLDVSADFYDDVWVLSLPSFTWTQVAAGTATHARAGHKCVTPYPDQMFVVGGYTTTAGESPACVGGNIVQLFNLSSAQWMTSYTPTTWSEYAVPDAVVKVIGGSAKGGATATAPAASGGWGAAGLKAVFATPYPTSKLTSYYPYPLNASAAPNNTNPDAPATTSTTKSGKHVPTFLPPLLGVIGGLIVVSAVAVGAVLYRRRRLLHYGGVSSSQGAGGGGGRRSGRGGGANTESVASTYDTGHNFVFNWLRAQPSIKHASTVAATVSYDDASMPSHGQQQHPDGSFADYSGSTPLSPEMEQQQLLLASYAAGQRQFQQQHTGSGSSQQPSGPPAEADSSQVVELIADTAHAVELPAADVPPGANWSSASNVSGSSRPGPGGVRYPFGPPSAELESPLNNNSSSGRSNVVARADSPSLGHQAPPPPPPQQTTSSSSAATPATPATTAASRFRESGVSDLSEQDRRHLRQGSEGGQSITSGVSSSVAGSSAAAAAAAAGAVSPLGAAFPPSVTGGGGNGSGFGQQPQPIPEAEAGAEAAAEAAGSSHQPTPPPPQQHPSQSQTSLSAPPGSAGDLSAGGPLRRSVFREREEDMKG